jgi:hypothetical protein
VASSRKYAFELLFYATWSSHGHRPYRIIFCGGGGYLKDTVIRNSGIGSFNHIRDWSNFNRNLNQGFEQFYSSFAQSSWSGVSYRTCFIVTNKVSQARKFDRGSFCNKEVKQSLCHMINTWHYVYST